MERNTQRGIIKRKNTGLRDDFFDDNKISDKITLYLLAGIFGAILMGAGDWLMIYGDVTPLGDLLWLTEGVANIEPWRNNLSMALAFPGVIFYAVGLFALKDVFIFEKNNKIYKGLTAIGFTPWLCIHLFYTMMLFTFAWLTKEGNGNIACQLIEETVEHFAWIIPVGEGIMGLPFLYLFFCILTGKSRFKKVLAINNPIIILGVLKGLTMLFELSPVHLAFTNGLMSESMLVFFVVYIIAFNKIR